MRLIDLDAFREEYDLREHCEDCRRRNKKECDYPSYSARDFCGWLDDVPTIDAVPLKPLCEWLAERYEPPYALIDIDKLKIPIDFRQQKEIWMAALTKWMEEQDATD